MLGLFLMPTNSFACEKIVVDHSCTKETSKPDKDDCCSKTNHSGDKNHDGCGGKCGHSMCGCASVCNGSISLLSELEFKNNTLSLFSQKQKFYNSETSILSGFYSIWLIPKIS
ncbi:MAG: hypothetical protein KAF41_08520 [Flavobacterium sp.]|uniref:hypothetical protein n=2 Tax=Flavobacterium TaxID=237 RepID=UPI00121719E2|nr:hypothetical protein [Flavobacterium lindanitolerans]MBU7570674.1 hypothetical protein [Flavobacterium sp.]THD34240.1 MAG: hypothetical protein DI588_03595 [Flavobacterium johnsoniae]